MAFVERSMFREYDIRGLVNDRELNPKSAELIGKAYGTFLDRRGIADAVVGFDSRFGSEEIKDGVVRGLLSAGRDVIEIGMCLTPMMYWAQYKLETRGGAMITGSHNPKGWNGLKLACGFSYTLIGEELGELLAMIDSERFSHGNGTRRRVDIREDYANDLVGRVALARPLKVVVDAGNGTAGAIASSGRIGT
ncbi:MAG: hypothetical protein HY770_02730 [Chitinivibrionia bacterium]|nr:hypothetical protein [Chitinivibrionia bacterium]